MLLRPIPRWRRAVIRIITAWASAGRGNGSPPESIQRVLRDVPTAGGLQRTYPVLEFVSTAGEDRVSPSDIVFEGHQAQTVVAIGLGEPVSKLGIVASLKAVDERLHTLADVEHYDNVHRPALPFAPEVGDPHPLAILSHLNVLRAELPDRLPAQVCGAEVQLLLLRHSRNSEAGTGERDDKSVGRKGRGSSN